MSQPPLPSSSPEPHDPSPSPTSDHGKAPRGGSIDYLRESETLLSFGPGALKRRRAALGRGALGGALTTGVLGVILLPDYLASHVRRDPSEQLLFALSLVLVGALIGFALLVSKLGTTERWTLDASREELIYARRLFGFSPRQEVLDLAQIREFVVEGQALKATLQDGYRLDLVHGDFDASPDRRFLEELSRFCRERHARLEVVTQDAQEDLQT